MSSYSYIEVLVDSENFGELEMGQVGNLYISEMMC